MDEKQVFKLSNLIVAAIVAFSMGKGKMGSLIPKTVANKLSKDADLFEKVKKCYVEYLSMVDNKVDESFEVKRLTDFRYRIVEIYTASVPIDQINLDVEDTQE